MSYIEKRERRERERESKSGREKSPLYERILWCICVDHEKFQSSPYYNFPNTFPASMDEK